MAHHENNKKEKNLYYLNELSDYKIASDDPDVRGWQVKDADNRVIGKVDNLLVNKVTERVVYLDVEVDKSIIEADHDPYGQPANAEVHEFINKDGENHIIIPVGLVSINYDPDYVFTDRINHQTFAETKRFEKGAAVNREYEVVVLESYGRNRDDYDRDANYRSDRRDSDYDRDRNRDYDRDTVRGTVDTDRDTRDFDADRRDRERRDLELNRERDFRDNDVSAGRDRGRIPGDDSFYERREFDDTNYRRRRR